MHKKKHHEDNSRSILTWTAPQSGLEMIQKSLKNVWSLPAHSFPAKADLNNVIHLAQLVFPSDYSPVLRKRSRAYDNISKDNRFYAVVV